jgi:hypothetical protein
MKPHDRNKTFEAILRGDDVEAKDVGLAIEDAVRRGEQIPPGVLFYAVALMREMDTADETA